MQLIHLLHMLHSPQISCCICKVPVCEKIEKRKFCRLLSCIWSKCIWESCEWSHPRTASVVKSLKHRQCFLRADCIICKMATFQQDIAYCIYRFWKMWSHINEIHSLCESHNLYLWLFHTALVSGFCQFTVFYSQLCVSIKISGCNVQRSLPNFRPFWQPLLLNTAVYTMSSQIDYCFISSGV